MTPQKDPSPLQVLIIGGGIAGLTLALALEHCPVHIEYLLLERQSTLTPQVGASIGLAPNGSRILDQLGVYEALSTLLYPVSSEGLHDRNGRCLTGSRTEMFRLIPTRMVYPVAFLERRELLRIISEGIRRRNSILTGKKVVSIEQGQGHEQATVTCTDGTKYTADIVVGADGIHSTTRSAMWQAAEHSGQKINVSEETSRLTAEYRCLFGISSPVPGLEAGSYDVTQAPDVSTLVITGKGGKVYWFLFGRMPCVYHGPDQIPRFTAQDAELFVSEHLQLPIRPQRTVTLAQIWEARQQAMLTALEEADFRHWAAGRLVCIGDSVHKMTPNSGSGGMLAIESAAALANAIHWLARKQLQTRRPATQMEIADALQAFEAGMHARASSTIRSAADVTRLQALRGLKERFLARFILPYAGDFTVNLACESWVGAARIDYIPVPSRSLHGNTPFNPAQGIGREPVLDWNRICLALPLLVGPFLLQTSTTRPTGLSAETCLTLATWYAITLIESARRANEFNILRFAIAWGLLVLYAPSRYLPVYYGIHYICSPVGAFKSADMRTTDLSYTRSVLPVGLLVLGSPYLLTLFSKLSAGFVEREAVVPLWKILPLSIAVAQGFLARYVLPASTIQTDRLDNVRCDLTTIRRTVGVLCVLAVVARQYALWVGGQYIFPADGMRSTCLAMVAWVVLFVWDLKAAGMVTRSWGALGSCALVVMVLGGEGALLGIAWLVRENVLATRRHRDALVERR
ncbi:hypothetical protein BDW72DRAFT_197825 [Aspergillus terricola var. indicus]